MGKDQDAGDKGNGRKAIAIITTVILAGVGGYAYASNAAYDSYASRVESAKEADRSLRRRLRKRNPLSRRRRSRTCLTRPCWTR